MLSGDYLRYQDIVDFVTQRPPVKPYRLGLRKDHLTKPRFSVSNATRLWGTMTAYLPLVEEDFRVIESGDKVLPIDEYREWRNTYKRYPPREAEVERRKGWAVGWGLIACFFEVYRDQSGPPEYGPKSRQLLEALLTELQK